MACEIILVLITKQRSYYEILSEILCLSLPHCNFLLAALLSLFFLRNKYVYSATIKSVLGAPHVFALFLYLSFSYNVNEPLIVEINSCEVKIIWQNFGFFELVMLLY